MLIQAVDGNFYGGFLHQLDGVNIKEDTVYTIYNKKRTEAYMATCGWHCKLFGKQSKLPVSMIGGVKNANQWSVEWIDVIPIPGYIKARTQTPTGDFKIFIIHPTPEELEGMKKGEYSERVKVAMGGTHLSTLSIKRRLSKSILDGVIYAY